MSLFTQHITQIEPKKSFPLYFTKEEFPLSLPHIVFTSNVIPWWNKPLKENAKAERPTRNSLENCREHLYAEKLSFLSPVVYKYLSRYLFKDKTSTETCITDIIKNVPVYLVTEDLCGKNVPVGKKSPYNKNVICPPNRYPCYDISLEQLEEMVKNESLEDIDITNNNEVLGLYQNDDPERKDIMAYLTEEDVKKFCSFEHISESRRIFLWVDKIKACAEKNGCKYESLLFFTLCHEFMHALMDVFTGDNLKVSNASSDEITKYKFFREESLANGLAIYLFNECDVFNADDGQTIIGFVNNQPLAYKMGLLFAEPSVLQPAVEEWMEIKSGHKPIDKSDIYNWFKMVIAICKQKQLN